MVREKARQYSVYTDEDVRGPILASASASVVTQATRRRWRDQPAQEFIGAFEMAAKTYIIEWMQKSPNPANGKEVLKAKRTAPKGFYAKVEEMANLEKGEASARFRDDNNMPRGHIAWNQYLSNNFDQIYQEFQESARAGTPSDFLSALTMQSPMSAASPSAASPMSMAASPSEDIPMLSEDVPEELETEETEDENYAVCTVSFNSILRKNLNEPIKTIFDTKMNMLVPSASDFVADFQLLVFLTMLSFRNHTFVLDTNQINFQAAEGFRTQDIFPDNFKMQEHVQHSASPLPQNHDALDAQIRGLFTSNHLSLLLSEFYGARGMTDASKSKYPLILSLINIIKPQYSSQTTFEKNSLNRECYVSALTTYQTNLSNMWAEKKMFKILLDKLLLALLRIHLSPLREKKHQEYLSTYADRAKERQKKKNEESQLPPQVQNHDISVLPSSVYRKIIRNEKYRLRKYNRKAKKGDIWIQRAAKSEKRIKTYEDFIIQKKKRETQKQTTSKHVVAENAPGPSRKRPLEDIGDEERAEGSKKLAVSVGSQSAKPLNIKSSKGKEPMRSPLEESAMAKKVSEEAALPPSPDDYSSVEEVDIIEEEDALRDSSQDASRRRIFELKGLMKSLLFEDDDLTRESLVNKRADLAEHEINVCLLIVTRLKPYIPSKTNYESIGHQLPFIILANDLLRCAGYARFNRNMCPMPSASLKAFRMNAESLYSLYCNHGQQKLRFFKYDGTPLQRTIDVYNHKDAVFNSFFDMASIQAACKRNKLIFAHNITILPGLQHVRLLGTKMNKPKETTASLKKQPSTSNLPESTWQQILLQSEKDKNILKNEIATLQKEVNDLSKNLKQAYKAYNDGNFGIQIKVAKRYWKNPFSEPSATQALPTEPSRPSTPSEEAEAGLCGCLPDIFNIIRNAINKLKGTQSGQQELPVAIPTELQKKALDDIRKEISQLINLLKEKRYEGYLAVEECKRELSDRRFSLYVRRRAVAMPKKDKGKQKAEKTLRHIQKADVNERGAIFKSEDAKLDPDPQQLSQDFVFSGTDNGIVKMSESVPVSLERYVYHLKLHNRFAALTEQTEPEFQPLPEAKTVSAEDVDFASRNFHYRHELALMKKNSPQVAEAEAALSRQNFSTIKNEEDVWNAYRCLQDNKNVVRSFYQNAKMKKGDMKREMFMKKSKDRVCARERLWLNPKVEAVKDRKGKKKVEPQSSQKQLVMMIGDRGMGVGSRIKRHLRYGGTWKQDNHARYTTVSITNENYTSQTCVYCFHKLQHPKQLIQVKSKTVYRNMKGAFHCLNPECPSVKNGRGVSGRDKLSALAIAISGITTLLFQQTLPAFCQTISPSDTEFNHKTASFCTRSGVLAAREA